MRKMNVILGMFVLALSLAGIASGQVGFGGGGGGLAGGIGRQDPVQLLNNASVKKELELTDEQTQAIPEAVMKALGGVLNEKQLKRFKQIELQQRGTAAFSDAKIQENLKFSDTQKDSIKTILEDSRKEMKEALGGGGGAFAKGGNEKLENLRKETLEKITGTLSADQKKSWREMTGDTFKLERPAFGGAGGGGKNKKKAVE